jgi:DNA (cytosine-5)-methyltransferase 1
VASAVSVPVAAWLGRRLKTPGAYDRVRDLPFEPAGRLPKAARFDGKVRHAVAISVDPLGERAPPLAAFLKHDGALLSPRATAGFLARTRVAKLRFAPGFIDAVEAHYRHVAGVQIDPKRVA